MEDQFGQVLLRGTHSPGSAENIEHSIHAKVLDFSVARGHHEVLKDDSEAKIGAQQTHARQADCSGLMVMEVKYCLRNVLETKREGFLFYGFARRNNTSNDQLSF